MKRKLNLSNVIFENAITNISSVPFVVKFTWLSSLKISINIIKFAGMQMPEYRSFQNQLKKHACREASKKPT